MTCRIFRLTLSVRSDLRCAKYKRVRHHLAQRLSHNLAQAFFELKESHDGDAYRSVYAVKLKTGVFVLHAFKKKSKSGKAMPREDIAVIEQRLKRARELDAEEQGK